MLQSPVTSQSDGVRYQASQPASQPVTQGLVVAGRWPGLVFYCSAHCACVGAWPGLTTENQLLSGLETLETSSHLSSLLTMINNLGPLVVLAALSTTVLAGDINRQSIIFNEKTPDVFYCPQVSQCSL